MGIWATPHKAVHISDHEMEKLKQLLYDMYVAMNARFVMSGQSARIELEIILVWN